MMKLKAITKHEVGRRLLQCLASMPKHRPVSDIRRFATQYLPEQSPQKRRLSYEEVTGAFKLLEEAGAGKIRINKTPTPHRFEWSHDMIDTARLALGEELTYDRKPRGRSEPLPMAGAKFKTGICTVDFGKDGYVAVSLPSGLSEKNVQKLLQSIKLFYQLT
jgi:hypothetical protein